MSIISTQTIRKQQSHLNEKDRLYSRLLRIIKADEDEYVDSNLPLYTSGDYKHDALSLIHDEDDRKLEMLIRYLVNKMFTISMPTSMKPVIIEVMKDVMRSYTSPEFELYMRSKMIRVSELATFMLKLQHVNPDPMVDSVQWDHETLIDFKVKDIVGMIVNANFSMPLNSVVLDIGTEYIEFLRKLENEIGGGCKAEGLNVEGFAHYQGSSFDEMRNHVHIYDGVDMSKVPEVYQEGKYNMLSMVSVIHHVPEQNMKRIVHDVYYICDRFVVIKDVDLPRKDTYKRSCFDIQHDVYNNLTTNVRSAGYRRYATMANTLDLFKSVGFKVGALYVNDHNISGSYWCLFVKTDEDITPTMMTDSPSFVPKQRAGRFDVHLAYDMIKPDYSIVELVGNSLLKRLDVDLRDGYRNFYVEVDYDYNYFTNYFVYDLRRLCRKHFTTQAGASYKSIIDAVEHKKYKQLYRNELRRVKTSSDKRESKLMKWKAEVDVLKRMSKYTCDTFPYSICQFVFDRYESVMGNKCRKVLDMCAGWGDRLIMSYLYESVIRYVGVDPNENMASVYNEIVSMLNEINPKDFEYMIHTSPFEDLDDLYYDEFDLMFTSPPYFNIEEYSLDADDEIHDRYDDLDSFFTGFVLPSMIKVSNMVKMDGLVAIVISNTYDSNLTKLFNEGCTNAGMTLLEIIPYNVIYNKKIDGTQYIMIYTNTRNYGQEITTTPEKRFMTEDVPDLVSDRLVIRQVKPEMLQDLNNLLGYAEGMLFRTKVTEKTLNDTKYFIGYLDGVPITLKGIRMTKWMYPTRVFSGSGSVTHPDYRRKGYMTEMKLRLFEYMKQLGIRHYREQVKQSNTASLIVNEKIGGVVEGEFDDMILIRFDLVD
jgi:tRNA1(Val) A37 N6-methylase TrmN6